LNDILKRFQARDHTCKNWWAHAVSRLSAPLGDLLRLELFAAMGFHIQTGTAGIGGGDFTGATIAWSEEKQLSISH
jgi:hypothetical protein